MACKNDLRKAVYDKVAEEAIENRYTFTRISDDTVRINSRYDNSKSKAQNAAQARAIAKNLIKSTYQSFEGHVTGYINQNSPYDPVTVTFSATDKYINWLYSRLPADQQTDNNVNFSPSYNTSLLSEQSKNLLDKHIRYLELEKWLNNAISLASNYKQFLGNRDVKRISEAFRGDTDYIVVPDNIKKLAREFFTPTKDQETLESLTWNNKDYPRTGTILDFFDNYSYHRYNPFVEENVEIAEELEKHGITPRTINGLTIVNETERNHIIHDTGINTEGIVNFNADNNEEVTKGVFAKYLQFKKTQVIQLRKRLAEIGRQKKIHGITIERLTALKKLEREIETTLEGNFEQGKIGIEDEIRELERNANTKSVQYYAEKDLQRLNKLSQSNDLDDLNEAQRIIDFWISAADFGWRDDNENYNPFFTKAEIFLSDENDVLTTHYKLGEEVRNTYSNWANRAKEFSGTIENKKTQLMVDAINSDPSIRKTYGGRKFSFEDITSAEKGLKDVDWVSMWTMDITQGIASHNGVIPQVMFSYLTNSFEKKLAWAREIEQKIDKMNPGVQKELMKLGYNLRGIVGLNGASYNLFKEISKEGNETGGIVQRFTREFFDEQSKANNAFNTAFSEAKLIADKDIQKRAFNKAFEDIKRWRRNNTIVINIKEIPEITSDVEFNELTEGKQPTTNHKDDLIKLLGQKGYDEAIDKQKALLRKYLSEKQNILDVALTQEGKATFDELSTNSKNELKYWSTNHSPLKGHEDFHNTTGIIFGDRKVNNFMDYNYFIPRQFKPNIVIDPTTKKYEITDTTESLNNYSENFKTIESNPILSEFYDVVKEVTETIKENMPPQLQQKMGSILSLPGLEKTSAEIIADKNIGVISALFESFKHMIERLRISFGVRKQSDLSYAQPLDPVTGKPNYKVNDGFLQGNFRAIEDRMNIEKAKFLQVYNKNRAKEAKMTKIKRFSIVKLSGLNQDTLNLLAEYTHTEATVEAIGKITGENVEIGKYIRDFSIHSVVQSQSFDLGKLTKYFSNMTMMYAARQEALPVLEIMKKHYENIKKPHTNNVRQQIRNIPYDKHMQIGFRTGAIKQMDDWFERVVLDNYGLKHTGIMGKDNQEVIKTEQEEPDTDPTSTIETKVPFIGKTIYTVEERKKLNEINRLLSSKDISPEYHRKLIKIKEKLGKTRTATAAVDNILAWIRTLRLGYNLSSMSTNFLEGMTSNLIIGASDQYFDPNELFYGYGVIKASFLKNLSFGHLETYNAKKNRTLMDKFNVIMDSKNELQKSSVRTTASKLEWLDPHAGNQRVEFINQSPLMIAMLRTSKIKGLDGAESSIWDAYDSDGKLKKNFRTEENIANWENLTGEEYYNFKQKLNKVIVLAHGNYDEIRGMMIKSNSTGKAFMMFKTWLPNAIYQRFAVEQDDIQAGTVGFKGKYRSHTATTAGLHAGLVGTALFGPIGIAVGIGVGAGMSIFRAGVQTDVSFLAQIVEVTKMLAKKMIGMPVNIIAGRKVIDIGTEGFNSWVGNEEFTKMDADNLKSNMTDISLQLAWLAMILITKGLFWDDEDDPEDLERIWHNIIVNKLMQLSSQGAMYINPIDKNNVVSSTLSNIAVLKYLEDTGKFIAALSKWANGESDTIPTGINAGDSRIKNTLTKLVLPGIFKDVFGERRLGFGEQSKRVFTESVWHKWFKSDESLDKASNTGDRASRRAELEKDLPLEEFDGETKEEQEANRKKYINNILNEELPTPARLRKLGMTREEYEEAQKDSQ